ARTAPLAADTTTEATAAEATPTGNEVVDLAFGDVRLELVQRGRRIRPVEATDRHDRLAAGELVARRVVRIHRRGGPAVVTGVGLQQRVQRGVGLAGVQEPASRSPTLAAPGSGTEARETAARARAAGRAGEGPAGAPGEGSAAGARERPGTGKAAAAPAAAQPTGEAASAAAGEAAAGTAEAAGGRGRHRGNGAVMRGGR